MIWQIIGISAGAILTINQLPQILKGIKTKKLDDLSSGMLACLLIGLYLWFLYGVHLGDLIIMFSNLIGLLLTYTLVLMRHYYQKQRF